MTNVHDSLLTGYTVDGDAQTLLLHTRPHQGGGTAHVDILFHGLTAYHFEGDCLGNIVFGINEVSAQSIVGDGVVFAERHESSAGRKVGTPARKPPKSSSLGLIADFLN